MPRRFNLQGHRGARGLKPENTLPSFEAAFDLGVTSVETDLHLTRDDVPVLIHDPHVSLRLCRLPPGGTAPDPVTRPPVRALTLAELRQYRADVNPDPRRFPGQDAGVTPLAQAFAEQHGFDPYAVPTLSDLFAFAEAYAGSLGVRAGKTAAQRERVRALGFDLETKRVPFRPEFIGDGWDAGQAGVLERSVMADVRAAKARPRTTVRCFDHRSLRAVRDLAPDLALAVLIAETAPLRPAQLADAADAETYCPGFEFLDEGQVKLLHAAGLQVLPWTVNDPADMSRLLDWGVDGITTDYPDRLAELLRARGIEY
jgi:glycerophosphoryl diester phosphodiesterase